MDEKKNIVKDRKSPGLAAVISAIFPGAGFFYIGNHLKGFIYMIIFASLIILEVNSSSSGFHSSVPEIIFFGLMIAGFYFFQIFDSYNEAKRTDYEIVKEEVKEVKKEEISLLGSIIILIIGILFLMRNLDVLCFRDIVKLWPFFLIVIGIKLIFDYSKKGGGKKDE